MTKQTKSAQKTQTIRKATSKKTQQFATRACTIGENKGEWRWFGQGKWLAEAGFKGGKRIHAEFSDGKVEITLQKDGERKVSGKDENSIPVIDFNTAELRKLGTKNCSIRVEKGKLTIVPAEVK